MRKTLFIMTHLGANWNLLKDILEQNPKVHVFQTDIQYRHHENLKELWDHTHRNNNSAAWWADIILKNKDFASKELAKYCKYVYLVAGPDCLSKIDMDPISAAAYYRFRLGGMYQWHKRSGGPWIHEVDLQDEGAIKSIIEEISPSLSFDFNIEREATKSEISDGSYGDLMEECRIAYEKYDRNWFQSSKHAVKVSEKVKSHLVI